MNTRNRRLLGRAVVAAPASGWAVSGGYQHAALLLDWARAVCAFHAVPVNDFATSFADGRVMCLMVRLQALDAPPLHSWYYVSAGIDTQNAIQRSWQRDALDVNLGSGT